MSGDRGRVLPRRHARVGLEDAELADHEVAQLLGPYIHAELDDDVVVLLAEDLDEGRDAVDPRAADEVAARSQRVDGRLALGLAAVVADERLVGECLVDMHAVVVDTWMVCSKN